MVTLMDHRADATVRRSIILVRPVTLGQPNIVLTQSGPLDVPAFPINRIQHVIARHTAAALNPKPSDGIFLPEWSTPDKLHELAARVYLQAGPAQFGAGRGGEIAFIAAAVRDTNVKTGQSTPHLIGFEAPGGAPTNIVVVFITPAFEIHTMYPTGPVTHFYGDDWS